VGVKNLKHPRLVGDVNGDGRADIIGFASGEVRVSLGKPDGTFEPSKVALVDFAEQAGGWSVDRHPRTVGDVNGDGRADIIGFATTHVVVALGKTDGTFELSRAVLADFTEQSGGWSVARHPRVVGDVNGDGRADIIGFATSEVLVAFGRNDGSFSPSRRVLADFTEQAGGWSVDRHPRTVGDVNGDGRADIIGFATTHVVVALGKPDGTFELSRAVLADFTEQSGGWQ
jgi:hypothetical protein